MRVLVINAGSSSLKVSLFELAQNPAESLQTSRWRGSLDWGHIPGFGEIEVHTAQGLSLYEKHPYTSLPAGLEQLLSHLWTGSTQVIAGPTAIEAVGHRVVHGGAQYSQPCWITPEVEADIAALSQFAPIHNPANLAGIIACRALLGAIPQVAVFDTAFHSSLQPAAYTYALPSRLTEQGIRRYGFHGISHQYCAQRASQLLNRPLADLRLVICHLGNGCSLSAVGQGVCVDTTMGFTPLEGLVMGTRSGSVDPGLVLYLLRQGHTVDQVDHLLNRESGLLGLSGIGADMRAILEAKAAGRPQAELAFDVFIHRLRAGIGAMVANLGGLDALVFTAGIGEHAAEVRAAACATLGFLGLTLDVARNARPAGDSNLAADGSSVAVLVIHTQEDWAIAQACWQMLTPGVSQP
ncbi:MAG: acetate kinase [Gloeomargaritaceae cyanobacterium C42_A2020_066]|nr:acetate kinase [Gloeomargaritaceae cyanobacterium C42_A2020_066]